MNNSPSLLLAALLALTSTQLLAADAGRGGNIFDQYCAECHSLKPGKHKKGPSLAGVFGRKAGSMDDYEYSSDLKNSGVSWTADKLNTYLANPKGTYPGIRMKFDGLKGAEDRADLIAFFSHH